MCSSLPKQVCCPPGTTRSWLHIAWPPSHHTGGPKVGEKDPIYPPFCRRSIQGRRSVCLERAAVEGRDAETGLETDPCIPCSPARSSLWRGHCLEWLLSLSTRPAMVWPHPRHFARGPFGVEVLSKPSQIASGGRPLLEDIRKLLIKSLYHS